MPLHRGQGFPVCTTIHVLSRPPSGAFARVTGISRKPAVHRSMTEGASPTDATKNTWGPGPHAWDATALLVHATPSWLVTSLEGNPEKPPRTILKYTGVGAFEHQVFGSGQQQRPPPLITVWAAPPVSRGKDGPKKS